MYVIIEMAQDKTMIEVEKVRTVEEAYDMLRQWMRYKPESKFEMMEAA